MSETRIFEAAKDSVLSVLAFARLQGFVVIDGATYITKDGWVSGRILTMDSVGGEAGKRRKRELEAEGWRIQKRQIKGSRKFEYRLDMTLNSARRVAYNYNGKITPDMIYNNESPQVGIFD